jgi:hypothetical protein
MILHDAVTGIPTPVVCMAACHKKDRCKLKYSMKDCEYKEGNACEQDKKASRKASARP